MTTEQFWTLVEQARDADSTVHEERLFERLCVLPEQQVITFDRLWTGYAIQLYTNLLWGTAFLARGGCSKERFADWRNWVVSQGREAYETARERPDDLVPVIEADKEAGREGIVDVIARALRARNSRWEDGMPEHKDLRLPSEPSGPEWGTEEDLKLLLPKTWARYCNNGVLPDLPPTPTPAEPLPPPPPSTPEPPAAPPSPEPPPVPAPAAPPVPESTPTPIQEPASAIPVDIPPAPLPAAPASSDPPSAPSSAVPQRARESREIPVAQSPVKKPWWKVW